jgi:ABC-type amino acid transport substrate-binding protein
MDENQIFDNADDVAGGLKSRITSAAGTVSDLAGRARTAAVEAGTSMNGAAIEAGKQVKNAAVVAYRQGSRAGEYVSRNTAEHPLTALLIAGVLGYGIAHMIRRH